MKPVIIQLPSSSPLMVFAHVSMLFTATLEQETLTCQCLGASYNDNNANVFMVQRIYEHSPV